MVPVKDKPVGRLGRCTLAVGKLAEGKLAEGTPVAGTFVEGTPVLGTLAERSSVPLLVRVQAWAHTALPVVW